MMWLPPPHACNCDWHTTPCASMVVPPISQSNSLMPFRWSAYTSSVNPLPTIGNRAPSYMRFHKMGPNTVPWLREEAATLEPVGLRPGAELHSRSHSLNLQGRSCCLPLPLLGRWLRSSQLVLSKMTKVNLHLSIYCDEGRNTYLRTRPHTARNGL